MIDFTVQPDQGEPWKVTATARDVLTWERTSRNKAFGDLKDRLSMEDMYKLAWIASRRQGHLPANIDLREFEQTHDLFQEEEAEEEADPTQTAPSGESSSDSPSSPASRRRSGPRKATAR